MIPGMLNITCPSICPWGIDFRFAKLVRGTDTPNGKSLALSVLFPRPVRPARKSLKNPKDMKNRKNEFNEITAVYRKNPNVPQGKISGSESAAIIARAIWPVDISHREAIVCLMMDNSHRPTGFSTISTGGITSALCDLRILYQNVLISNAVAIVLVHNHPSGTLRPSEADKDLTRKVKRAGELLDIKLLDHIILTETSHYSFSDEGLL